MYYSNTPGGEGFSQPSWTTAPGATSFTTPPVNEPAYFVVRARDQAGNEDHNTVERQGMNPCEQVARFLIALWAMERHEPQLDERDTEHVRQVRLRADGERAMTVNLQETIVLSRKLFELHDAARCARERTVI